jgi:hypothetical protein
LCVARVALRTPDWIQRFGEVALAAAFVGAGMLVLGWQAGGAIGSGRLRAVGASPWQLGLVTCGEVLVVATAGLAAAATMHWVRAHGHAGDDTALAATVDEPVDPRSGARALVHRLLVVAGAGAGTDSDVSDASGAPDTAEGNQLAG